MTTTTFATANLAALKSFLVSADAYVGVSSAMKFDGWRITDVRAYAERVQALREAGYTAAIAPRTVDAAEQQVAAEAARVASEQDAQLNALREAAAAKLASASVADLLAFVEAHVAATVPARKARKTSAQPATDGSKAWSKVRPAHRAQLAAAIERASVQDGHVYLTASDLLATGWGNTYAVHRSNWSKTMPGGLVAMEAGYNAVTRADKSQPGGFVVVLVPVAA